MRRLKGYNVQLASGAQCQIEVTFAPRTAQDYSGTISWTEAIPGGPSQQMSVAVSGTIVSLFQMIQPLAPFQPVPATVPKD